MFRPFLILILCLSFASGAIAKDYRFTSLNSSQGLSHDWVRCFFQDERGMMWIGTSDGLDRFDGREIKTFRPKDRTGKHFSTAVNSIARFSDEVLWVGTDNGLYSFNFKTEVFVSELEVVSRPLLRIDRDSLGSFWLSTDRGLKRVDADGSSILYEATGRENSLPHHYVNVTQEDSQGRIWVGTKKGLAVLDRETGLFRHFGLGGFGVGTVGFDVLDIEEDQSGRIWVAESSDGLLLAQGDPNEDMVLVPKVQGQVIRIAIDRDNNLWIASGSEGGLVVADLNNFDGEGELGYERFKRDPSDDWSLSGNTVFEVFEDRLGDIWIGMHGKGVNFYSKRAKEFRQMRPGGAVGETLQGGMANCFLEEEDFLWFGTNGGLERLDKRDGSFKRFRRIIGDDESIGGDSIFAIHKDSRGNLWVGGWTTGLNRYDYETETFKRFMPEDGPRALASTIVFAIDEDADGRLWVGTLGGGLNRFDYETESFEVFRHDAADPSSISSDDTTDILITASGEFYVSSNSMLDRFDPRTGRFEHFRGDADLVAQEQGGFVVDAYEDSIGQIWLATLSGLELFNPRSGSFKIFSKDDGLPSESVQSILEDSSGNLWLSSNDGLIVFEGAVHDPLKGRFKLIPLQDGLSSSQFNPRASMRGKDGTFYFGSTNGVTYFKPAEIRYNETAPEIVLTSLLLLEQKPNATLSYREIERSVVYLDRITLGFDEANFMLKFSALNYLNPGANSFRYRLSGYNDEWIDSGVSNSVAYSRVPPGEYEFQVIGANNDGVWSQSPASLQVVVLPPWWGTLWFRSLIALCVLALVVTAYRIRFAILRRNQVELKRLVGVRTAELSEMNKILEDRQEEIAAQNDELNRHRYNLEKIVDERTVEYVKAKEKAEESEKLKSSFLMNMSHEVRTPMNAIIGFSNLLRSTEVDEKEYFLKSIEENGRSLLVLIDEILDVSLIEANQINLYPETFDVYPILAEHMDVYNMKHEKEVVLSIENPESIVPVQITADLVRFRELIGNLVSNAYKYTDAGEVVISCRVDKGMISVTVADTGIGISESDQEKVFDHFYKVELGSGKLYRGTGIGLAICRKLAAKMGGGISLESELGKGSAFTLTLPVEGPEGNGHRHSPDSKPEASIEGLTLLVAEDNETNFEVIDYALRGKGATIVWVQNGIEALNYVADRPEGIENLVVLMDIEMPLMDGREACKILKEEHPGIRIMAVTAHAQSIQLKSILEHGFDSIAVKPISIRDLPSMISELR